MERNSHPTVDLLKLLSNAGASAMNLLKVNNNFNLCNVDFLVTSFSMVLHSRFQNTRASLLLLKLKGFTCRYILKPTNNLNANTCIAYNIYT